jgi:hypothetical protein
MEHIDSFEEFLKKKTEEKKQNIDWGQRKRDWIESVEKLYSDINEWLKPFIDQHLIDTKVDKIVTLTEEYIGTYEIPRLDIYIAKDIISLTPKGTLIIGSSGRIDMIGPKAEIMLIEPKFGEWLFAERTPKLKTWELNKESFQSFIQKLV